MSRRCIGARVLRGWAVAVALCVSALCVPALCFPAPRALGQPDADAGVERAGGDRPDGPAEEDGSRGGAETDRPDDVPGEPPNDDVAGEPPGDDAPGDDAPGAPPPGDAPGSDVAGAPPHGDAPGDDAPGEAAGPGDDALGELSDDDVLGDLPSDDGTDRDAEGAARDAEGVGEDAELAEILDDEDEDMEVAVTVAAAALDTEEPDPLGPSVYRLDEEALARFRYDDPHAQVLQVPGVYVQMEDGFGLRPNIGMRGVSPQRSRKITLMEDGVLFGPAPYSAPSAYFFPLLGRMVGMDVYLGPAALPYGPYLVAGAIDWRSRPIPREPHAGVDLSLGSYLTGRAHAYGGTSNEWGGFLVEGLYLHSDGFKNLDFPAGGNGSTGFDRGEIILRGDVRGATGDNVYQTLEARLGLTLESSHETYLGLTEGDFRDGPYRRYGTSGLDRMRWWRTQAQLRWTLEVGEGFQLRTTAYRHDFDRDWFKVNGVAGADLRDVLLRPDTATNEPFFRVVEGTSSDPTRPLLIGNNGRRYASQGIQSDATLRLGTGEVEHQARFGARFHWDTVTRDHTQAEFLLDDERVLQEQDNTFGQTADNTAEAFAVSAYTAWTLRWRGLTVTPGIRLELIWTRFLDRLAGAQGDDQQVGVLPGISAAWELIDGLSLVGGVQRGFSPAAPSTGGDAEPERSVLYEAGVRYRHEESRTRASAIFFFNDYSNLTVICSFATGCPDDAIGQQTNAGAANVLGAEVAADSRPTVGSVAFPLRLAYTYVFTELRTAEDTGDPLLGNFRVGDRIPYIPPHQLTLQAGVEGERAGASISGSFVSSMWEQAGRGTPESDIGDGTDVDGDGLETKTQPYFLLDATVYLQVFENLRVYVRGENLTFTQRIVSTRPFGARPNRPFLVQGGVRVEY
ncbi:MAG: TonB-dependent receptor domain-containing protein [Sandaracinaceae bacterium]